MNLKRFRPGQRGAFEVTLDRFRNEESFTTLVLPTRYGKSDLMRCVAYVARDEGLIGGAIAFTPALTITKQLVDPSRLSVMGVRYGLDPKRVLDARRLTGFDEYQPFSNNEYFLAANMQLALRENQSLFLQLVHHQQFKTKRPLVLFIDECQFVSEVQRWGEFVLAAANAGCFIVLVTATAIRDDGAVIPGFERECLSREQEKRYQVEDVGDGKHNRITPWIGAREVVKLKAHWTTTFKEAWNEPDCPLCHVEREVIDIEVTGKDGLTRTPLSKLSPSQSRKVLDRITRDPAFLELAVCKFLEALRTMQAVNQRCAGMVLTGNDSPFSSGGDNAHALAVKELVEQFGPQYLGHHPKVAIVTMKTSEDGKASTRLEDFVGNESRDGTGDVLIVKRMGIAGLDGPRVKVLLDCSATRTVSAAVQGWMRPATPFEGLMTAQIIMPADPLANAIYQRFIVDEGGEIDQQAQWVPEIAQESYLKKKPDPDEDLLGLGDSELAGYDDSHGNVGDLALYEAVNRVIAKLPDIRKSYTKPQIASALIGELTPSATPHADIRRHALDESIEGVRRDINREAYQIVLARFHAAGRSYTQDEWVSEYRQLFTAAYRACGVQRGTQLKQIVNVETLNRLLAFMQHERAATATSYDESAQA